MAEEKILDSEKLEMEELENVVGGTLQEIDNDVRFLKDLGLLDKNFYGDDELKQVAVNKIVAQFNFRVIADRRDQNIVKHINRRGQLRNSSRELMLKAIAEKVKPGFDYKAYL